MSGIVLSDALRDVRLDSRLIFGLVLVLLLVAFVLHRHIRQYRRRWVVGIAFILAFMLSGFLCLRLHEPDVVADDYRKVLQDVADGYCLALVSEPPVEKEKSVKIVLELKGFRDHASTCPVSGKVLAYFQKNDAALSLGYGDLLAFSSTVEPVPPSKNLGEFDYRTFLERRGVTGRVYLKEGVWIPLGIKEGNPLVAFAIRFRKRLLDALWRCGVTEDEFSVGAAVLLGYDDSLPPVLRQQYMAAGSMHILCVSGMHVGIIYLLASFVLGFLGSGKKLAFLKNSILLLLVWFYALITGLTPSILRSTLMISMIILGSMLGKKGVTLNSVAASAFVILLFQPNDLFSMGFQLSYAAVVGIVVLQRPIYLLLFVSNKLLDKAWEITSVALAAQFSTLPFTVFYFHQFTPYFWLSNLLMTPLSFLVILSGMLLLLLSWVPGLNVFMGKLVWACLHGMNASVAWIESLPCSLVKGLYMTKLEFGLSLLLLLLFMLLVTLRKKRMLLELLTVACVFAGLLAARGQRAANQCRIMVYSLRDHTAIDMIQGTSHLLLCDEELLEDPSSIDYSLRGSWAKQQLSMNPPCYTLSEDVDTDMVVKRKHLCSFHGCLLAIWDPFVMLDSGDTPMSVDVLLVRGRQAPDQRRLNNTYRPRILLLDGTVPAAQSAEWKRVAAALELPCHVLEEGCFVMDL